MTPPPAYQGDVKDRNAYVYLIRSVRNGSFYVGWTTNLKHRLDKHNSGKNRSTKAYKPWELIYYETYHSVQEAKKREKILKHNSRMMFLFKKRGLLKYNPTT